MSELDNVVARILARHVEAVEAAHNGDQSSFLDMWSTKEPVTLLGAKGRSALSGWEQVTRAQRSVFSRFSNGTPVDFELVAADLSGDVAHIVGYERSSFSMDGGPVEPHNAPGHAHLPSGERRLESSFTATRIRRVPLC